MATGASQTETCVSPCRAGAGGNEPGELPLKQSNNPTMGSATDADGHLYLAARPNNRVDEFEPSSGDRVASFGTGAETANARDLYQPSAVTLTPTGNVLVAERSNSRISEFSSGGTSCAPSAPVSSTALPSSRPAPRAASKETSNDTGTAAR